MKNLLFLAPMLMLACDPGAPTGPFELLDEGAGDTLLEAAAPIDGATFWFFVDTRNAVVVTSNEGFLEHNGLDLQRRVTEDEIVYEGARDDAALFFGTDTGGLLDEGVVTLSFPIRAGRRWTSGIPSFPDMFEFEVITAEPIETPAGRFDAVRVDQLNRAADIEVARWFVAGIGSVHRIGPDGPGGPVARSTLVEYSIPGEAP